MTDFAIQTKRLSKTFGKGKKAVEAVIDLDLEVQAGQVFGFLGPNGAGKTTTIRLLMDLIRPTHGESFIFGEKAGTRGALQHVGALVEGADFYPFMTGWDNLAVLSRTANDYQPERIENLLTEVGLAEHARKLVGEYSTGMKQRLGLAAALLGDPDLLIFDEPTNGLDPAGIQEMRGFIRDLAERHGKTVFLSSHMLKEVEQVCDQVAIINRGRVIEQGSVAQLLSGDSAYLRVQVDPFESAMDILRERWPVDRDATAAKEGGWVRVTANPEEGPAVIQTLVKAGIRVYQVIHQKRSLEEFFITVTNSDDDPLQNGDPND